jgi:acyl-CoA synthetase (AMP-forming)/AMP-acid ligase II
MVVDPETGLSVGPNEAGELWVRGPQVMAGYLNEATATAEILDPDGWLRTGDLGYVDVDENVVVVDRLKELIKVDGYQVAPAELESLLLSHRRPADAAVIGRPDDRHGELPIAHVVVTEPVDASTILAWVAERVAAYECIADLVHVDELPRTPSGRLLRRLIRQ